MCHVKRDQQEKSITKIQINRAKTFTKLILSSSQHLSRFIHFLLLTFTSFFSPLWRFYLPALAEKKLINPRRQV